MDKIKHAMDIVEELKEETIHILNVMEIMGNGIFHDHNDCKDCEVSCIYLLSNYLEKIHYGKLDDLLQIMKDVK